jgi:hypothetical protein
LIIIGILIGSTITYVYLSGKNDAVEEDRLFLCKALNEQTELTNKCGDLLTNITGYEITKSNFIDCSN